MECACHLKSDKRLTNRDIETKKKLINRLKRIEGQIRGIISMVERDEYCTDILLQTSASTSALNAFNKELLSLHIKGCVVNDIKADKTEVIDDLLNAIERLMK